MNYSNYNNRIYYVMLWPRQLRYLSVYNSNFGVRGSNPDGTKNIFYFFHEKIFSAIFFFLFSLELSYLNLKGCSQTIWTYQVDGKYFYPRVNGSQLIVEWSFQILGCLVLASVARLKIWLNFSRFTTYSFQSKMPQICQKNSLLLLYLPSKNIPAKIIL